MPVFSRHLVVVIIGLASVATSASVQTSPDVLLLTGANLIDGISARPLRDMTVIVRAGRIERIARGAVRAPDGAQVIDLGGRWLLPGLVDAHVHFRSVDSARTALYSGVTTARSLGVPHFADMDIRQRHRNGASDLPDVLSAGYHVRRRIAPEFFLDAPQLGQLAKGLSGPEDVRLAVREMVARGADVIKVMVTERAGVLETEFLRRDLNDAELGAAVEEAKSAGLAVAAHAHSADGVRAAVLAGAGTIEHGTLVTRETLALMKSRGVCLVPTITFWQDMMTPGGEYDHPTLAARATAMLPRVREAAALAWAMGVSLAAGTDTRYEASSGGNQADEIGELVGAGVPPMAAIKAATSAAAGCLGIGRRTGAIGPGLEADMIVLERDPLQDLRSIRNVVMVINDGRVAINHLVQPRK